jgi:hypothetical protein
MSPELTLLALRTMGLPVNKIISRAPIFFIPEDLSKALREEVARESARARAIFWDDAGLWMSPAPVYETWALYGWRFFISREAPLQ